MAALNYLHKLAERRRFGIKPGLEKIRALLDMLGNPEREMAAIHIAGTNGKGSVAALCDSVLRCAGYNVGRYTSPHLICLNERFMVNGQPASDEALESAARPVESAAIAVEKDLGSEVTFFEALTAVAFILFRERGVKLTVLETGLGGRWDATNVVVPMVSVITRIALDHCAWLGDTLAAVAAEKAGIIKPGRPVVCAAMPDEAHAVITSVAAEKRALLVDVAEAVSVRVCKSGLGGQTVQISTQLRNLPPVRLPLAGTFQVENVCVAVAALDSVTSCGLEIPDEAYVQGLAGVCWPGRFHLVSEKPPVVVDGAHNPDGARALRTALKGCGIKSGVALVAGFCGDKDILALLRELAPVVKRAWAVKVPSARSVSEEETAGMMRMAGIGEVVSCGSLSRGLLEARECAANTGGVVVVCGSLFLAGETLRALGAYPWDLARVDENESVNGAGG
ncbi:MAG: bifunctional folylpolyglutamate synthase/dihydrofolate synthase [Kiritimatiellae bacterium]|nr:bifunctional folylpolyglutamate synthase/dihydrofolate synthase [Kiritimatiellia bacterium]